MSQVATPIEVFCSYAPADEPWCRELETHLSLPKRQGVIATWYRRDIAPGTDWTKAVDAHLNAASVILLLISPDFLASDYCYGIEMKQALDRHHRKEARVIPILLRPTDWEGAPFAHLQYLPRDGRPVTTWSNRDEAFVEIAKSIRAVVEGRDSPADTSPSLSDSTALPDSSIPQQEKQLDRAASRSVPREITATIPQTNSPVQRRSLNLLAWLINFLATAVLSIILRFTPSLAFIPFVDSIQQHPFSSLILACGAVLLTLIGSLMALRFTSHPHQQTLRHYLHSWGLIAGTSTISFALCFSLLMIVLLQPPWCPSTLCHPPIIVSRVVTHAQGVHDANLDTYFLGFQSASYALPSDLASNSGAIPDSKNAQSVGAFRIDGPSSSQPYRVILGVQSLYQGKYSIIIEHVMLVIKHVLPLPRPLRVWTKGESLTYNTNLYKIVYNGETIGQTLFATYTTHPQGHVQLGPGEPEQLDIQIDSLLEADIQFEMQVTYRLGNESQTHTLTLPQTFEVAFSKTSNWDEYRLLEGRFVPAR